MGSCPTDKRKLGLRLSRVLEVGVPGSMDEGQMEDSGVFRDGSTACLASESCTAKNNVKTRLPPGCLTKNGGWMLALDWEATPHRGHLESLDPQNSSDQKTQREG